MKADERPEAPTPAAPGPTVTPPIPPEPASAGVGESLGEFWETVRGLGLFSPKLIGSIAAVAVVVGGWWWLTASSQQVASRVWTDLGRAAGPEALEKFVAEHPNTVAAKIARLEEARRLVGPDGIGQFTGRDPQSRSKAVENVEKGRDALVKLADEFPADLTLKAECLRTAAEAELALVGIPKAAGSPDFRGTVEKAVELYKRLAQVVGETTPVGEKATKRAEDLTKNVATVRLVGMDLYRQTTPQAPPPDLKPPADVKPAPPTPAPPSGLVAPAPIPTPAPPAANPAPPPATNKAAAAVPPTPDPAVSPLKPAAPPPTGK